MEPRELRPGLWRWTAAHPDWEPAATPESPADWPRDVGSVLYETDETVTPVDPLLPSEPEPLLRWLDERVRSRSVVCLTTIGFHRRSRDAIVERYGASTSRARGNLPAGVETFVVRRAGETMVWLPGPRALVPGDRLLGDGGGGLRLCPESWLRYLPSGIGLAGLRHALRPLLDLPIELVLVSHGEPVLAGGREAIARALR
jgi:hypothetical protein